LIRRLIENVNSCVSQLLQCQLADGAELHHFESLERRMHFEPGSARCNVLFASATHGYAFCVEDFARMWRDRLGLRQELGELSMNTFSPDHFFSPASQCVQSGAEQKGKRTLFEQWVL